MGELIRRGLVPTVGQNPLSNWLESPQVLNPVSSQNTSLQISQNMRDFQQKVRYHQDSQTLVGVETVVRFDVTVPKNERWWIEWLGVEHSAGGTVVWQVRVLRNPFFNRQLVIAQRRITQGIMQALIGNIPPLPGTGGDSDVSIVEPYIAMPGENIEIQNVNALAAPIVGRIQVRYRHIPLPLELEAAAVGLWQATTL